MKKLFGLFLLALAFLAPSAANAVSCFWVGGTATWDTTNTGGGGAGGIKWASASGGGTACAGGGTGGSPSTGDTATFDANSGGGTVTVNFGGLITIQSLTFGAFTGTLDFATNNNSITLTDSNSLNGSGTGTRTLNMGDGTWTLSNAQALWNCTTVTNFTLNANGSTVAFTTAVTNQQRFQGGGKTYNIVTFAGGGHAAISITGANTFGTLTITNTPVRVAMPNNATTTITNFTNISGSASAAVIFESDNPLFNVATISSANNWTCDWCTFNRMTFTGGGTFTANNSLNAGNNTGITFAPSGGGGGGRIIGG